MEPNQKPNTKFEYYPQLGSIGCGFSFLKVGQSNQPIKANMFKGQGVISKLTTLSDRTIRIQMDCQEQSPDAEFPTLREPRSLRLQ